MFGVVLSHASENKSLVDPNGTERTREGVRKFESAGSGTSMGSLR